MLEPFNRTQPVHYLSLGLSKSLSYKIISLRLCFIVLSVLLPWKCSTCVSLVSTSTIKVVQCYIFYIFFIHYTGKSKKKVLENTGISCSNLDGHPEIITVE